MRDTLCNMVSCFLMSRQQAHIYHCFVMIICIFYLLFLKVENNTYIHIPTEIHIFHHAI